MIPENQIQKVLEATDILEVAQRYIRLRRSGKEHFGLCPFHSERTPSFTVNPTKGAFFCRGCQKSGNVIKFVMLAEGLSFPVAVRLLAEQAGVEIGNEKRGPEDAYVRQVAAEARWYWDEVRSRYGRRQARAVAYRNLSRRRADAEQDHDRFWTYMRLYRRYARSVARWERILARLDGRTKGDLLARYISIRQRHPEIANAHRSARELETACAAVELRAAAMIPTLPPARFVGLMRAISAHFA